MANTKRATVFPLFSTRTMSDAQFAGLAIAETVRHRDIGLSRSLWELAIARGVVAS